MKQVYFTKISCVPQNQFFANTAINMRIAWFQVKKWPNWFRECGGETLAVKCNGAKHSLLSWLLVKKCFSIFLFEFSLGCWKKLYDPLWSGVGPGGGAIGAIATPKTYVSIFIHHHFVQFRKQHLWFKRPFCCSLFCYGSVVKILHLYSIEAAMTLDY